MRIAYFDCFSGASGDMTLGALVDAGVVIEELRSELAKLSLEGFSIGARKSSKKSIACTKVTVSTDDSHTHRNLSDIVEIIQSSRLVDAVKKTATDIFTNLAEAEASVHGIAVDKVHFHEVGAIDAIVDIVGAAIALDLLRIERVVTSRVHTGTGFVDCQHGLMPVPAPATLELLKGIPVYSTGINAELVTPTGAAILKTISDSFGSSPEMTIHSIGYGAGERDLPIANLLRVWIGEAHLETPEEDEIVQLETNVDNMTPELIASAIENLQGEGVLDVFMTPVIMKKSRPAVKLTLIVVPEQVEKISQRLFAEVSTLGIRYQRMRRKKLLREIITVKTKFGPVDVKLGKSENDLLSINPEFESCRSLALKCGVPTRVVFDAAKAAFSQLGTKD